MPVKIHGKEYITVAERLGIFLSDDNKGCSIITEIISIDDVRVIMKASIKNADGTVLTTGHAEEKRDSTMINKTSALENAETSAVGRALAFFGYAGSEIASADEVANAISNQGEKPQKSYGTASEAQLNYIRRLAGDKLATILQAKDIESLPKITPAQASEIINELKGG